MRKVHVASSVVIKYFFLWPQVAKSSNHFQYVCSFNNRVPQGPVVGQVLFTLCMLVVLYLSILLLLEKTAHILLLCR